MLLLIGGCIGAARAQPVDAYTVLRVSVGKSGHAYPSLELAIAVALGFENFPTTGYGVTSSRLKRLAAHAPIPRLAR